MVTFIEWLKTKKGVVIEGMGRQAQMTHEQLPDTSPETGQVVILMDRPKANITNGDLYYVLNKTPDEVTLVPKAAVDQNNPRLGGQLKIPRQQWMGFTLVNHLLTRKERMERLGMKPVWIIGSSKDRWIANREAEIARMKRGMQAQQQGTIPHDVDPIKLAQVRKNLTGPGQEPTEDPSVTAARSWLKGI